MMLWERLLSPTSDLASSYGDGVLPEERLICMAGMEGGGNTQDRSRARGLSVSLVRTLLPATAFGLAALAIVLAGLTIPIPGTGVVTDPREIFTTTGADLTGPLGGIVIGILAGIGEPGGVMLASLLAHVSGGLWMGFSYKPLVHNSLKMPGSLIGWVFLVLAYYYVFVVPGFVIGQALFYPDGFIEAYGAGTSLIRAYTILGWGALPEALLTTLVTTLVLVALPIRYRRPLW